MKSSLIVAFFFLSFGRTDWDIILALGGDVAPAEGGAEAFGCLLLAKPMSSKCISCLPGNFTLSPLAGENRMIGDVAEVATGEFACTGDTDWAGGGLRAHADMIGVVVL